MPRLDKPRQPQVTTTSHPTTGGTIVNRTRCPKHTRRNNLRRLDSLGRGIARHAAKDRRESHLWLFEQYLSWFDPRAEGLVRGANNDYSTAISRPMLVAVRSPLTRASFNRVVGRTCRVRLRFASRPRPRSRTRRRLLKKSWGTFPTCQDGDIRQLEGSGPVKLGAFKTCPTYFLTTFSAVSGRCDPPIRPGC
jgi:hypothetical protein